MHRFHHHNECSKTSNTPSTLIQYLSYTPGPLPEARSVPSSILAVPSCSSGSQMVFLGSAPTCCGLTSHVLSSLLVHFVQNHNGWLVLHHQSVIKVLQVLATGLSWVILHHLWRRVPPGSLLSKLGTDVPPLSPCT